jgi:hypothetical protein
MSGMICCLSGVVEGAKSDGKGVGRIIAYLMKVYGW